MDGDEDGCSEIVLVPGGRFLMTEDGGLSLWDLGLNTEEARKMTIVILASEDGRKLSIWGLPWATRHCGEWVCACLRGAADAYNF